MIVAVAREWIRRCGHGPRRLSCFERRLWWRLGGILERGMGRFCDSRVIGRLQVHGAKCVVAQNRFFG